MSNMSDETLRLDGNTAAGLLEEIFPFEMTTAQCTCASCGQTWPLGTLLLYGGEMGAILRCPTCDQVQTRFVRVPGQYWINMRGHDLPADHDVDPGVTTKLNPVRGARVTCAAPVSSLELLRGAVATRAPRETISEHPYPTTSMLVALMLLP